MHINIQLYVWEWLGLKWLARGVQVDNKPNFRCLKHLKLASVGNRPVQIQTSERGIKNGKGHSVHSCMTCVNSVFSM